MLIEREDRDKCQIVAKSMKIDHDANANTGDDERAGGGFAPGFEAGLHRSSHPQVAGAA